MWKGSMDGLIKVTALLEVLYDMFLENNNIPKSMYKDTMRVLGLDYEKYMHARMIAFSSEKSMQIWIYGLLVENLDGK